MISGAEGGGPKLLPPLKPPPPVDVYTVVDLKVR